MSEPLLESGGWCRRKVNKWEWMLDGRAARIPLCKYCGMRGQRLYRNCWVMNCGITGTDDRTIGTRIGGGLHNSGGNVVINYITQNGGWTGVGRAYRYYRVTDGVVRRNIIENECWMGGPPGTTGRKDWYRDWRRASQHWNGGLTGVWRACRYYGVTNGVVRRYIIRMNVGWAGGPYTTL
ncbi:hypothetical protein T01_8578 [Trichinella spiralis]|uniref:Uncharacterized protein n=1 Tax=Trichinella spiralis TaxID=6334 RepID=A0A0V1AMA1_TRISP|nr:hypothetical protein T01_8578 [Trichinella spiralis]